MTLRAGAMPVQRAAEMASRHISRRLLRLLLLAALALIAASAAARAPVPAVEISLARQADGDWRLRYDRLMGARRVDLGPTLAGARAQGWRVLTEGAALVSDNGRDYLVATRRGRGLTAVEIAVTPRLNALAKDYETAAPLGAGVVFYTGHFIPFTDKGWRMTATVAARGRDGDVVSAFGESAARVEDWASPYRHPAFLYIGPDIVRPVDGGAASLYLDPSVPGWIERETARLAPSLLGWYAAALGAELPRPPDVFLSMRARGGAGQLRYDGDALPGQMAIAFSGEGWRRGDSGAEGLLHRALAHEAAHLWQGLARPSGGAMPDWIHEGGADALAVEALAALGLVSPAEAQGMRAAARADCERELAGRSLDRASREGRWRAVYACGHALTLAAARAHNKEGSVALFWRDFLAAAAAGDRGYDLDLFVAVAGNGDEDAARAIRRFPWTNHARPARELARMAGER